MNCAICGVRKPKRQCPGVRGEICSVCCGTEREQTIDCPLTCEYLREAHRHEKPAEIDPAKVPHAEIRLSDAFLRENEPLLMLLTSALLDVALRTEGANDNDVRDALDSLIRTYKTRESGLYYESMPENTVAAALHRGLQERIAETRKRETAARGVSTIRDASLLGILVFLQRLELAHNNGRKRSRAFLESIAGFFALNQAMAAETPVEPPAPRIIV